MGQVVGKLVMTGRHRRMRREHTLLTDGVDEISGNRFFMSMGRQFLFQQSKHEQGRVPFIHMEPSNLSISEHP